ncbi:MAG: MotA/TolQ/ExbB proton channel family protein [candidate division KSB1 bacterium]|nr:MotA/TolQ/ExbB proton channel family protein [candidate division KSB1 bacterium]
MSLLQIMMKGGVVMILIYILSIVSLFILVERLITLRKLRINTRSFVLQIRNLLLRNQVQEAILLCRQTGGPIARLTQAALQNADRPRMEIKDVIETAGKAEIYHLEKYLGTLATIASIAPMVGFFGTVTGMIRAFMAIQARGGNVDATVLAGGIWEALVTTAAGLVVGILSLIFYNYIQGKVEHFVFEMEETSAELLDALISEKGVEQHEFANK